MLRAHSTIYDKQLAVWRTWVEQFFSLQLSFHFLGVLSSYLSRPPFPHYLAAHLHPGISPIVLAPFPLQASPFQTISALGCHSLFQKVLIFTREPSIHSLSCSEFLLSTLPHPSMLSWTHFPSIPLTCTPSALFLGWLEKNPEPYWLLQHL